MKNVFIILFIFLAGWLTAQQQITAYIIGLDLKSVDSIYLVENENTNGFPNLETNGKLEKGNFTFTVNGLTEIPRFVFCVITANGNQIMTDRFYIDSETEKIVVNYTENVRFSNVYVSPLNKNQIDFLIRKNYFTNIDNDWKNFDIFLKLKHSNNKQLNDAEKKQIDSISEINFNKQDTITEKFISQNQDSYIALWDYYKYIPKIKSKQKRLDIFNHFGKDLKESLLGLNCLSKIKDIPENEFPNFQLQDQNFKKINFNVVKLKKYTLVDFWFSYCAPCLSQMPKYRNIYDKYRNSDFEIIGISTDRETDIKNWQKTIVEKKLIWQQFLDVNGTESLKYGVDSFPTNFLIDSDGKIIKKNISPEELEKFLEEHLQN